MNIVFTESELIIIEFCLQARFKVLQHRIRVFGGVGSESDMLDLKEIANKCNISWDAVTS